MSSVARAQPGTVFIASPPATVVTTDVISGRPSARLSMRSVSRASALTALRPRAVSAPACAGTPVSSIVRHSAPLRAETRSPFSRPHSNTRAAVGVRGALRARRVAQPHLLVRADDQPQLGERALVAKLLHRHRGQHQAALHVGDPGTAAAQALAPEGPLGDGAEWEDGVAVAEQGDDAVALARQCDAHAAGGVVGLVDPLGRRAQRREPLGEQLADALLLDAVGRRVDVDKRLEAFAESSSSRGGRHRSARSRTAPRARDRPRCGSRSPPRTRACPRPRTRARAATSRSSRSSAWARPAAPGSRARA